MQYTFTIDLNKYGGKKRNMPSLNEWIDEERTTRKRIGKRLVTGGGVLKKKWQKIVETEITKQLGHVKLKTPIHIVYHYYEKDKRRDKGNIHAFPQKVIEDALQGAGLIPNDGWNEISNFYVKFDIDADNPRIEVTLVEEINDNNKRSKVRKPRIRSNGTPKVKRNTNVNRSVPEI